MEDKASEAVSQIITIATTYGVDILGALAILVIGWIAAGWASRATEKAIGRARRVDVTLQQFFASLVKYAIIIFTVLRHCSSSASRRPVSSPFSAPPASPSASRCKAR